MCLDSLFLLALELAGVGEHVLDAAEFGDEFDGGAANTAASIAGHTDG